VCFLWGMNSIFNYYLDDLQDEDKGKGKVHPRTSHEGPDGE